MQRKINLFVDAHVFDGIHQGTMTYIAGLYSELVKDERFQIYVGSSDRLLAEKFLGSNNFIHVKYNSHSKLKRLLFTIPNTIKVNKIDFAHFQYISPLIKRCKYIVTIHDLLFLEFPENFPLLYRIKNSILFYLSGKRAEMVTTVSNYSKKSIHNIFKLPLDKITITPNAIKTKKDLSEPITEFANKKYILYVSRIEPRKNQALLIRLWKELELFKLGVDLVMVGSEGVTDKKFLNEVSDLNSFERPHFYWLTKIPDGNLIWLYENCSLFVFPTMAEGFGIPPLEAAMYGAKVICSNKTAMADFDFFDNFMFSPENEDEFKMKIIETLKNEFPHQSIKDAIEKKYNWNTIATNFGNEIVMNHNNKSLDA